MRAADCKNLSKSPVGDFRQPKPPQRRVSAGFWYDRVYKPGSVLTAIYLAPELLLGSSRLLGTAGPALCPSTALLRDRVYIVKPMLPWAGWALTPPFHPCWRLAPAVSLCCTCPEIALGGRYPLSLALGSPDFPHPLPFGMRPRLSDLVAGLLYSKEGQLSNVLQNLFFGAILLT